jgi:hypothetical protein
VVHYSLPAITPNCSSATLTQLAGLPPGAVFPPGVTVNVFEVTDLDLNTAQCSFTVTVSDTEAPAIECPSNIHTSTVPGQCQSAAISFDVLVTDNCGTFTAVTEPPSGTIFPVGTNTVTTTAWDEAGNTNVCTFLVIVRDIVGPQLTCPDDIVTNAITSAGARVDFPALTATGNCTAASVIFSPPSGTVFPAGTHTALAIAVDGAGNQTACEFTVTVKGPRTILLDVVAQVQALQGPASGTKDAQTVQTALDNLRNATAPVYWGDDLHVFTSDGKTVFQLAGKAAKALGSLSRKSEAGLDPVLLNDLARITRDATRALAAIKLDDAANSGGDPKDIDSGRLALERADETAASGAYDRAIKGDSKAWQRGVKAVQ